MFPAAIGVRPERGKYARAVAMQTVVEAGNEWLPNPRPHGRLLPERAWVEEFLDECCAFPQALTTIKLTRFPNLGHGIWS